MAFSVNNSNVYNGSQADTWTNGDYINSIDATIRNVIPWVNVATVDGTLSRRGFLLSATELVGPYAYIPGETAPAEGLYLDYFPAPAFGARAPFIGLGRDQHRH